MAGAGAVARPHRLLLVGMMGAGKTTVGQLAAARLGWPYLDSDAEVVAATGKTVPEIFAESGEAAFRAEETKALERALALDPVVVSVAGGAVLSEENRRLIRGGGTVVWLRAQVATLVARVGDGAGRPLLEDGAAAALARLDAVRRPLYAEVADTVIDVEGRQPAEVASAAIAALGAEP